MEPNLQATLQDLEAQLAASEAEQARVTARTDVLRDLVVTVRASIGKLFLTATPEGAAIMQTKVKDIKRPRGSAAVRSIMSASEGKLWSLEELLETMIREGAAPKSEGEPILAVRAAVNRLRNECVVKRTHGGLYQWVPEDEVEAFRAQKAATAARKAESLAKPDDPKEVPPSSE